MKAKDLRNKDLYWEGYNLCYNEHTLVRLVPDDKYQSMYHLEFRWRNFAKTPEMFNIVNARENARIYALKRLSSNLPQSVLEALGLI